MTNFGLSWKVTETEKNIFLLFVIQSLDKTLSLTLFVYIWVILYCWDLWSCFPLDSGEYPIPLNYHWTSTWDLVNQRKWWRWSQGQHRWDWPIHLPNQPATLCGTLNPAGALTVPHIFYTYIWNVFIFWPTDHALRHPQPGRGAPIQFSPSIALKLNR